MKQMNEVKHFTCIGCPVGCPLKLEHTGGRIVEVAGYECNRGAKYARQEFYEPRRSVSTTIAISGALWRRLPVKVNRAVHKDRVKDAVRRIHALRIEAPVSMGQIIVADFLGEKGLCVVASRSMPRIGEP